MAERLRFHLDENMDPEIAASLRRAGVDVTTTAEQHLLGESDTEHFRRCIDQARVIVTDDPDFLILARSTPVHPGIVFCRRTRYTIGDIIRFLILMHQVC